MTIELWRRETDGAMTRIKTVTANADGRTDEPMMTQEEVAVGRYELRFWVGEYFSAEGITLADPPFLDIVPVAFAITMPGEDYHVPLLVSPWSYSTYRGS